MLALVLMAASLTAADYAVVGALLAGGDRQVAAGDLDGALRAYRAAAEMMPQSAVAWRSVARAYQLKDERTEAWPAHQRAERIAPPVLFPMPALIHMDCWGNGGPCPAGTKPVLSRGALSPASVQELLRHAQVVYHPGDGGGPERVEIRTGPVELQRQ